MTEIVKKAWAGTLESSDAYVEIEPAECGVTVELQSVVQVQFGASIIDVSVASLTLAVIGDESKAEAIQNLLKECTDHVADHTLLT